MIYCFRDFLLWENGPREINSEFDPLRARNWSLQSRSGQASRLGFLWKMFRRNTSNASSFHSTAIKGVNGAPKHTAAAASLYNTWGGCVKELAHICANVFVLYLEWLATDTLSLSLFGHAVNERARWTKPAVRCLNGGSEQSTVFWLCWRRAMSQFHNVQAFFFLSLCACMEWQIHHLKSPWSHKV